MRMEAFLGCDPCLYFLCWSQHFGAWSVISHHHHLNVKFVFSSLGYFSVGLAEAEKNKNEATFLFFSASANPTEKYPNEANEKRCSSDAIHVYIGCENLNFFTRMLTSPLGVYKSMSLGLVRIMPIVSLHCLERRDRDGDMVHRLHHHCRAKGWQVRMRKDTTPARDPIVPSLARRRIAVRCRCEIVCHHHHRSPPRKERSDVQLQLRWNSTKDCHDRAFSAAQCVATRRSTRCGRQDRLDVSRHSCGWR
jgi:hypothetical protein